LPHWSHSISLHVPELFGLRSIHLPRLACRTSAAGTFFKRFAQSVTLRLPFAIDKPLFDTSGSLAPVTALIA
jgi:hypothetical protein